MTTTHPLRGTTQRLSMLRKTIARRMVASLQSTAQLTTVVEVDVTAVSDLRARLKDSVAAEHNGLKLNLLPYLCHAALEALKLHPAINASLDETGTAVTYHGHENLAIAVATDKGLMAPVIKDAGSLGVIELAGAIADLSMRARTGALASADFADGTFTITNTGSRGALFDTPVVNQPNVAILGTGAVVVRPVAHPRPGGGHDLAFRSMMYLALSYDHRLVDGADAAAYLGDVKRTLENAAFDVTPGGRSG